MQFFVTLTLDQATTSPAQLQSVMTEFVENELQAGTFVITGGLASHTDSVRVELSPSGILSGDARLPVHGFAVVEATSLDQAVEVASRMNATPPGVRPGLGRQFRGPAGCDALPALSVTGVEPPGGHLSLHGIDWSIAG
jgi:hypothetical protein